MPVAGRWRRLARFHLANGLVSIVSNTLLTLVFKQSLGLPLPLSNLLAIAGTAFLNFALANAFVFREAEEGR